MTSYCCVCRKRNKERKFRLSNPKRLDLRNTCDKWLAFINNPSYEGKTKQYLYKNIVVCSLHFTEDNFTIGFNKKSLKYFALPSLYTKDTATKENLPRTSHILTSDAMVSTFDDIPEEIQVGCSSTLSHYSNITATTTTTSESCKKIPMKHVGCKRKLRSIRKRHVVLKKKFHLAKNLATNFNFQKVLKNMSVEAAKFIKCQIREAGKQVKGHRFTFDEKVFSLSLYKQGPKAYRYYKQFFALPSKATLLKILKKLPLKPGVNELLKNYLKEVAVGLEPADKCCLILFDEIFLSPGLTYNNVSRIIEGFEDFGEERSNNISDHALVFMVRGLQNNWKFPFAFYFSSAGMKTIQLVNSVKHVVTAVEACGLDVLGLVCDQGSNNVAAINLKNTTKEECVRKNVQYDGSLRINGRNILHIFDVPHLMKGVRNNLLNANLAFTMDGEEGIASWDHIEQAYDEDKDKTIRAMPKLSDCHVRKQKIHKMKVKFCTQVFSQRVASPNTPLKML